MSCDQMQGTYGIGGTPKNIYNCDRIFEGSTGQYIAGKGVSRTVLMDK